MSVVGIDDVPLARYLTPPLTTAFGSGHRTGRYAWQRMWDSLNGRAPGTAIFLRPRIEDSGAGAGCRAASARPCADDCIRAGVRGLRPNPIAGYEDWPAAVRSAGPYVGARRGEHDVGPGARPAGDADRPTVVDEGSECLSMASSSVGCVVCWLRAWTQLHGCCAQHACGGSSARRSRHAHCHGGVRSVGGRGWLTSVPARVRVLLGSALRATRIALHGERGWCAGSRRPRSRHVLVGQPAIRSLPSTPRLAALLEAQNALWQQSGVSASEEERFDSRVGVT